MVQRASQVVLKLPRDHPLINTVQSVQDVLATMKRLVYDLLVDKVSQEQSTAFRAAAVLIKTLCKSVCEEKTVVAVPGARVREVLGIVTGLFRSLNELYRDGLLSVRTERLEIRELESTAEEDEVPDVCSVCRAMDVGNRMSR